MYKVKIKKTILTFTVIATCLLIIVSVFSKYSYSTNREEVAQVNVKLSGDTKETTSKDTEEIVFKVQDNPNVAKGKIAPGTTAIAKMEVDLTEIDFAVDFKMNADTSKLPEGFKLTAQIDGENYQMGEEKVFDKVNEKKTITLTLTWEDNNSNLQTMIGTQISDIHIPINWTINEII